MSGGQRVKYEYRVFRGDIHTMDQNLNGYGSEGFKLIKLIKDHPETTAQYTGPAYYTAVMEKELNEQ